MKNLLDLRCKCNYEFQLPVSELLVFIVLTFNSNLEIINVDHQFK